MLLKELRRDFSKRSLQVGTESLWRLICDLHRVLEYGHWEVLGGHGAEEETEARIYVIRFFRHGFYGLLHRQHPRSSQVTVLTGSNDNNNFIYRQISRMFN